MCELERESPRDFGDCKEEMQESDWMRTGKREDSSYKVNSLVTEVGEAIPEDIAMFCLDQESTLAYTKLYSHQFHML